MEEIIETIKIRIDKFEMVKFKLKVMRFIIKQYYCSYCYLSSRSTLLLYLEKVLQCYAAVQITDVVSSLYGA
jgi:hypothetical protein